MTTVGAASLGPAWRYHMVPQLLQLGNLGSRASGRVGDRYRRARFRARLWLDWEQCYDNRYLYILPTCMQRCQDPYPHVWERWARVWVIGI